MQIDPELIKNLEALRKELHQFPELAGHEKVTPETIKRFVTTFNPNEIIEGIGGTGVAFVFNGIEEGPTLAMRADMDALPIDEVNDFVYKSTKPGVGHKCGHDGHMVMVAGLAAIIAKKPIKKGKVVLFFQPAEETGQGAFWVVEDEKFKQLKPDFVFGLHNLPGFPSGSMVLIDETFAAASTGLIIRLIGKTAHAAEPENGNTPAIAMANIIKEITYLPQYQDFKDLVVSTIIHARLGEIAFGTTPGYAEVMATLRAFDKVDFDFLKEKAQAIARNHAHCHQLKIEMEFVEEFPATINKTAHNNLLRKIASENNIEVVEKNEAFRWSEDFGHYLNRYEGAFWGLGSGTNHPQLHNPDYDFPDEIIPLGITIFDALIDKHNR